MKTIATILGARPQFIKAATITNAWNDVHKSLENGKCLRESVPRADVTKDMAHLAEEREAYDAEKTPRS